MNCSDDDWPGIDDDADEPMDLVSWWRLQARMCKEYGFEPPRGGVYSGEPVDLETIKLILKLATQILGIFVPVHMQNEIAGRIQEHLRNLG